jgi:beta-xylosidase
MPLNPIIPGFAPDPSILLHNGTYYLVNSSFHLFPGLPIFSAPSILGPWTHIANALHTKEQLSNMSLRESSTTIWPPTPDGEHMLGTGGLYAPTLRHHNGTFYVVCTNVLHHEGVEQDNLKNFILSAKSIEGPWSNPVYFDFHGIDPSIFWDVDGKVYIHGSASPGPATRITQFEVNLETGEKLSEEKLIWEGVIKFYPEGPHMYFKDGWYWLMIAEGGTHEGHMIEMARSKSVWGPFEPKEGPILKPAGREERVQYTGHGDLIQDEEGKWWAVCLGVRKEKGGDGKRFIMGRETFLTAVEWEEGQWPEIKTVRENLEGTGREDLVAKAEGTRRIEVNGALDWVYLRDPVFQNFEFGTGESEKTSVKIKADIGDFRQWQRPVSFVGKKQRWLDGEASVTMKVPADSKASAGLAVHKDEHRFAHIFYDAAEKKIVTEVYNLAKKIDRLESESVNVKESISFRISYTEASYTLSVNTGSGWSAGFQIDSAELSGPDFVGPVMGVFAIDQGEGGWVEFVDFKAD